MHIRRTFFDLPLHRDTGFYVSNFTILNRKINYSLGWNAHFAFCGKVLPELFYSGIYLRYGGERYSFYSRIYYATLNYFIGIIVGISAYSLTGANPYSYLIGLIIYGFLSSKPFFGVYFESAEQFEILPQTLALLLISWWMKSNNNWLVFIAFSLIFLDAFFAKLSSIIFCFVVSVMFVIKFGLMIHVGGAFLFSFFSFCIWTTWNKKNLFLLFFPALHHEKYWSPNINLQRVLLQISRKTKLLLKILSTDGSFILMAPIIGNFILGKCDLSFQILCAVCAGFLLTYYAQPGLIWYYTIPLIPSLTLLATLGLIHSIEANRTIGLTFFLFSMVSLFAIHMLRYRGSIEAVNLKIWKPYGSFMAEQNMGLKKIIMRLRNMVKNDKLFLYGVCNQLYAYLGTAYPTRLVCGAAWLDHIKSDWQIEINNAFLKNAPQFIFASDKFFNVEVMEKNLGLKYIFVESFCQDFKLFRLQNRLTRLNQNIQARPYETSLAFQARESGVY